VPRIRSTAEGRFGPGRHRNSSVCDARSGREGMAARDLALLREAVCGLQQRAPDLSASTPAPLWQKAAVSGLIGGAALGAALAPEATLVALLAVMALPFLMVVALRAASLWQLASRRNEAAPVAQAHHGLPVYSILVPMLHEAAVVPHLIAALQRLDYPADKLDVLLIVESFDAATRAALLAIALPRHMSVLVVPEGAPGTKPRACQYALQHARGDYVVVYDAEDCPEPDQLRRALAAFRSGNERLGCLQAQLNIYNSRQSWLTRQFTLEYTALFDAILPALERLRLPVPLGGTSNHFPRAVLDEVGGWDPYNVTEDADLGIRLARSGWQVGVLPSTTWEEAPPTFAIWVKQRTRWLKGWMQTYLVHMRTPMRLWHELGARGFLGLQVLMGGLILSALVHPWFYVLVAADLWQGRLLGVPDGMLGRTLLGVGLFNVVAGYLSAMALGAVAAAQRARHGLALHAVLMPLYWLGISFAAYRALWQLSVAPYYWEKTEHFARLPHSGSGPDRNAYKPPIAAE
jgi:cellulose synthase/poly-beta-1,6-N-acetylglucosamine synthase-like glycosyltransferase